MADLPLRPARQDLSTKGKRLVALTAALDEAAALWRPRPFVADPPWLEAHPEVAAWCESLAIVDVIAIERAEVLPPDAPTLLHAWQARLAELTTLTVSTGPRASTIERRVPERKLAQIDAFIAALDQGPGACAVLDWCGGKGHLGRTLGSHLNAPVTVLERNASLADDAMELARAADVALNFVCADALAAPADLFGPDVLAVGLHACGELGTRMLEHAVRDGVHTVALSPCCLHKVRGLREQGYLPLSAIGRAHDPQLDHESLRLATADEVVARASLQAGRRRENAWRLGFDLLARRAGRASYTPLGTITEELTRSDFASFAKALAERYAIALPTIWDPVEAEAAGWQRADRARAIGLVRGLFKRAIEVWCALDRAAFLEEHGLDTTIMRFAPRAITPRNLIIVGRRPRRP